MKRGVGKGCELREGLGGGGKLGRRGKLGRKGKFL